MVTKIEKVFDALVESAAEEALKQEMDELPCCEELDLIYKPTPEMNLNINRIIDKYYRSKRIKKALFFIGKIAACLIVLFIISATVLLSVEASRNYILNSCLKRNDKHSIIDYSEENKSNEFSRYSFDYIPEGFKLCCVDSDDFSQLSTYINDKNVSIHITETYADLMTLGVDNEYNIQYEIMINNFKAYLFENVKTSGLNILVWNDGNIAFEITSSISGDQLILIAENIIRK